MPIYEYRCKGCGGISEIAVGISIHEDPLRCPKCGGSDLEKLMSTHNIAVKRYPPKLPNPKELRDKAPPPSPDDVGLFIGMSEDKTKTMVLPHRGGEPIAEWDSNV